MNSTIDTSEYEAMLARLNSTELRKAQEAGIRRNANIIKRRAYANFGNLKTKHRRGSGRLVDSLWNGKKLRTVSVKVAKKAREPTVFINILGDFRAKFFEGGTSERSTRGRKVVGYVRRGRRDYKVREGKPRRTGRVMRGRYFRRAIISSEPEIVKNMEADLSKAIVKLAQKK